MTLSGAPQAQARAQARWATTAARLRSVTPSAVGRGALAAILVATGTALSVVTWPALLPFLAGAILAYAVLPVANRLDRFMPRPLAALLAEFLALGILAGVAVVVVPPLVQSFVRLALLLPSADEVAAWLAQLQGQLGDLPEPVRGIVLSVLTQTATGVSTALGGLVEGAGDFLTRQILGVLSTVTFVVGLLVIPAWVLTIVADERTIKRRAEGFVAPALRPDVVALFRIVDRSLSTFLRIQVVLAIATGVLIWVGLELAQQLGIAQYPYAVAAAVLLGALQLIPQLGYFFGFFPVLLVLVLSGPVPAATALVVYVVAARIASDLIGSRVARGVLDVHPALLIPAIVVLSEFGPIWLLAAAPVVGIVRDLSRYISGRLSDPPMPAGLLPGQGRRDLVAVPPERSVPSVYRDRPRARPVAGVPATVPATRSRQP